VTGPVTYGDAADLPFTDVLNRWQALEQRDAMARAIATLQARGEWHDDRSLDPADYPPLTVAEHLQLIALGEVAARRFRHPAAVHQAVLAGATWEQIADAAGGDPDEARQAYRAWAEEQHDLRQQFPGGTIGLGDEEYAAAIGEAGQPDPAAVTAPVAEDTRRLSVDGAEIDLIMAGLDVLGVAAGLTEDELAVKAALLHRLAVPGEDQAPEEDTRRLGAIRDLLARFDWEHHSRQYALEEIERIADGGQP
jgi:hypothetical protein